MPWSEPSANTDDGSQTAQGDGEAQRSFQVWDVSKVLVLEEPQSVLRGSHGGATSEETLPGYGKAHPTRLGLFLDRYNITGTTASTFTATALYSSDGRFGSLERPTTQGLREIRIRTSSEMREDTIPDATLIERIVETQTGSDARNFWIKGEFAIRVRVHKILLSLLLPKDEVNGADRAFVRRQTDNLHFFTDTTDPPSWHLFTGAVFADIGKSWRISYEWISDPGVPAIPPDQVFDPGGGGRYWYPHQGESTLPGADPKKLWTRAPFHVVRYFSRNHIRQPNGDAFWPGFPLLQRHPTDEDAWRDFPGFSG